MDIKELHSFKLSDAVKFHDQLNPKLFKNDKLDPKVREQLLIIAQDFMQELGISGLNVKDITLSGSNAAYTYTKHSDCDLHILIDMAKLPEDEVYRELFNAKKTLYNDSHDIKVHGVPVELYVQDTAEPVKSLGEYSVLNDDWISFPKKRKATLDITNTKLKFSKLLDVVKLALKSGDLTKINDLLQLIKRYRQAGLDTGGEFSPENLAFKSLRSQGLIKKLYDVRGKLHSKELSIENVNEATRYFPRIKYLRPGELRGSYTDKQLIALGFKKSEKGTWYIPQSDWERLVKNNSISEEEQLAERLAIELEDYDPNGPPPGPEFKPTMPKGTVKVDVSDVYDWYKLGQHISNLKGLGKHDFGKGPPSTILSFGDEDVEHQYIKDLEKTGLSTTDIDPVDPKQPKGMKRQKVDPTYNVNEDENTNKLAWRINFGDKFKKLSSLIPEREGKIYLMPLDHSALETFSNLTGEEPDQINKMPSQVYTVSGDALVGDMSIINEIVNALHYMEINKSNLPLKQQYQSHIAKLKKRYVDSRVPYSQYRPGKFEMPEILAEPSQLRNSDKSIRYNNKTDRIEIKDEKKLDHTYKVNESEQLFEVNFNDPKIINDALAAGINCGFEAESIWPIRPSIRDPWDSISSWSDLSNYTSNRQDMEVERMFNDWLMNHSDHETYWDKATRIAADKAVENGDYINEFIEQHNNENYEELIDPNLDFFEKQEEIESHGLRKEYRTFLIDNDYIDSDDTASEALELMKKDFSIEDMIEAGFDGDIRDFGDRLGIYIDDEEASSSEMMELVADELAPWINSSSSVKEYVSGDYHSTYGDDRWRIERDGSIYVSDSSEETGAEIISPVFDTPNQMLSEMFSLFDYFDTYDVFTNSTTGLHVTMDYPTSTTELNKLKVALLLGDRYILKLFNRENNDYTKSQFSRLQAAAQHIDNPNNLKEVERILNSAISTDKYYAAHFKMRQDGLVEFRVIGGADYERKREEIKKTVARYAITMLAGHDPNFLQKEYVAMLSKLVRKTFFSPSGDVLTSSFLNVYNKLTDSTASRIDLDNLPDYYGMDRKAAWRAMLNPQSATPQDKAEAKKEFMILLQRLVQQYRLKSVSDMDSRIVRTTAKNLGFNSVEQIVDELGVSGYDIPRVKSRAYDNLDNLLKTRVVRDADDTTPVTEGIKTVAKLGPQLFVPRRDLIEGIKPNAELWTSSSKKTPNGYTSAWVEWCKDNEPSWLRPEGILFDVAPGARILVINTDKDAVAIAKQYGIEVKDSMELFMKMRWDMLAKDYDAIHHIPKERYLNLFMSTWDVESTAWFNKKFLVNPRKVKVDTDGSLVAENASGYIPSNAEKNDPRFKSALTVDIKPDTLQKNAKKLGWKISRAGIPPLLRK